MANMQIKMQRRTVVKHKKLLEGNFEDIKNSIIQHRKESVVKKLPKRA